jgi:anti-sigma factor RsiW
MEQYMAICYETGVLRAYLDGEGTPEARTALASHLATCTACASELEQLRSNALLASTLFPVRVPTHAEQAKAFAQIMANTHQLADRTEQVHAIARSKAVHGAPQTTLQPRRKPMETNAKRRWLAPVAILFTALALLALPPVRAAADQVLQIFRVQTVVFVPISQERIQQLERLNFNGKSLFLAEPKLNGEMQEPQAVADAAAAAAAVGFTVAQPTNLPNDLSETTYQVTARTQAEFQVNVAAAHELLQLTGVTDVTLPDALGAQPISVDMAPAVVARYQSGSSRIDLMQGIAPQISLPEGVELRDLGRAGLRILGMAPEQADALASQIDWSSTLVFPFPADLSTVRQVTINGAPGLMVTAGGRGERTAQIYWQRGERFFVLHFESNLRGDIGEAIQVAESVR